jgi:hypothetical protein
MWRRGDFKDCFSQRGGRCFDMILAPGWWGTRRPSPAQGGAEGFLKKSASERPGHFWQILAPGRSGAPR